MGDSSPRDEGEMPDFAKFLDGNELGEEEEQVDEKILNERELALAVTAMLSIPEDKVYFPENKKRRLLHQGGFASSCQVRSKIERSNSADSNRSVASNDKKTEKSEEVKSVKEVFSATKSFFKRKSTSMTKALASVTLGDDDGSSSIPMVETVKSYLEGQAGKEFKRSDMTQAFLFDDYFLLAKSNKGCPGLQVCAGFDLLNFAIRDMSSPCYFVEDHEEENSASEEEGDDDDSESTGGIKGAELLVNMIELVDTSTGDKFLVDGGEPGPRATWVENIVEAIQDAIISHRPIRASGRGWKHGILLSSLWAVAMEGKSYEFGKVLPKVDDVDEVDDEGATALHYACLMGHTLIVKQLIAAGASKNVMDNSLMTPLHYTAVHPSMGPAYVLLDKGADADAKNLKDQTPVYIACVQGATRADIATDDEAKLATENKTIEYIDALSQFGADLNAVDVSGDTALIACISIGNIPIVAALLRAGVDTEKTSSSSKQTALLVACSKPFPDAMLVTKLLAWGANPNAKDKDSKTALHSILSGDMVTLTEESRLVIDILISYGARIDLVDKSGNTAESLLRTYNIKFDDALRQWEGKSQPAVVATLVQTHPYRIPFSCDPGSSNWEEDGQVSACRSCACSFGLMTRRHHCRRCGQVFCGSCCNKQMTLKTRAESTSEPVPSKVRVCTGCFNSLSRSLTIAGRDIGVTSKQINAAQNEETRAALFGDAATRIGEKDTEGAAVSGQGKVSEVQETMQQAKIALIKRGEKLNKLADNSAELNNNAANFSSLARQLREREEKKASWFGFF
uniref:FYVE-type domain-containing protein n=1 Tax=Mucochytrium quahogii TaxID=96639 RepID=A0A7S2WMD2_9STRA|mmetsp:Transcript_34649/g.55388  ORF Transcript_34649/g.55388 Transcript_34649/m.55388 type:complete len:797 (-) Transcript_34649:896-3286(-)|eukprot:CAMPEP_0203754326 /NCGR_PEP_ID=MMETSP0098-20131031/7934_1 /ASSEMBLY_ACC=CAM_ASM_000208 /TAXON_ID=96639 /ORGANISM=" , Strain NY0313808BC1" /LENGTH=796 /DNA_ID=CAMNT_0050645273 /DNA_START=886 /DNA_END=3276 /DNA_ORIENTATION=+